MTKKTAKTSEQVLPYDVVKLKELPTTSSRIRYLTSMNISRSDIVKIFNEVFGKVIRYQHVRNVQVTLLKKDM